MKQVPDIEVYCDGCGSTFVTAQTSHAKYCPSCADKRRLERMKLYMKKRRLKKKGLLS